MRSRSNWNLEVLVFEERGKPEYPEKNLSEQEREPTVELMSLLSYVNDSRKDVVKRTDKGKMMPGKRLLVATIAMLQLTSWLILPQDA